MRRPSRPAAVVAIGSALVVVAAVLALALDGRDLVFLNGIAPEEGAVELKPKHHACESAVDVVAPFVGVRFAVDTAGQPGPPLEVTVLDHRSSRVLRAGRVAGGYLRRLDAADPTVTAFVGRVRTRGRVDVCIANAGAKQRVVLGGLQETERASSTLVVGARSGRPIAGKLTLAFVRQRPKPLLLLLPAAFERAALFHPGIVGPWTFWLLAAVIALGVPLLLARAVSLSSGADGPAGPTEGSAQAPGVPLEG